MKPKGTSTHHQTTAVDHQTGSELTLKAEARFLDLVNTIDGVVWEADADSFDFTYVSEYAEQLLGYPVNDWYKPGFWISIMHPDDQTWAPKYCLDCLNNHTKSYEFEYRAIAKDGTEFWLHDLVTLCFENNKPRWLRGIMVDITKRKQVDIELESVRARFRTMHETAPVGILFVDGKTDEIVEMNPAYCQIVGRDPDKVRSDGWESYTHMEDYRKEMEHVAALKRGAINHYNFKKRYIRPDKSIVWVQQKVASIDNTRVDNNGDYLITLEDITERKNFQEEIWRQANYDLLTGLPNRNMLQSRIGHLVDESKRNNLKFALLMIDLDGFKDVNDTLGHDLGDKLLITASQRIKSSVRDSDTVARLGGDEFVVVLSALHKTSGVGEVAGKIIQSVSNVYDLDQNQVFISASIGITIFPRDADQPMGLLKNADQAMYRAKDSGRNRYQFFTQDMQVAALDRMRLISDLRIAVSEKQFELHYQPIVEISSGELHKAEALIRWNHNQRGLVSPAAFIPIAEETGFIIEIGDWVFREAVNQLKKWHDKTPEHFQISVNTSPVQFEQQLEEQWSGYMQKKGVQGREIGIEITETLFMTSNDQLLKTLLDFRDAGVQVSLDDFGTGYSSLSYLKKFDIDYLKIDRSFVQNLHSESDDLVLCAAIIVMAHKLDIKVIAEGIETEEQLELLKSAGCDYGQGYYFSKPLPVKGFEEKYL